MNNLIIIGVIFVASTFVITTTPNKTMAYSCSSSSGTLKTSISTSVSGGSGSCSTVSSSASSSTALVAQGSASAFPGKSGLSEGVTIGPGGHRIELSFSASSGGAQSSCSSSSGRSGAIPIGGSVLPGFTIASSSISPCP